MMRVADEPLPGVKLIELEPRRDERGFFLRAFCQNELTELGTSVAVAQANISYSKRPRTLRGLHYQLQPSAEIKLVTCQHGALYDVVLDLRPASPTYGRWAGIELQDDTMRLLVVPPGCAHGFLTLVPDTLALYFVSAAYDQERERGVRWNDPTFAISWPFEPSVLSERDQEHPTFDPAWHLDAAGAG